MSINMVDCPRECLGTGGYLAAKVRFIEHLFIFVCTWDSWEKGYRTNRIRIGNGIPEMKIRGWNITSFGAFSDYRVEDLPTDITVLHGASEAEIDTLLAFLRCMLFGFSTGKGRRKLRDLHPAIRDGRHCGKIFLESSGGLHTVERALKPQTDILLDPEGRPMDESDLLGLMGENGRSDLESVFTFRHQELIRLDALHGKEIDEGVFPSSLGGVDYFARKALKKLTLSSERFFEERGKSISEKIRRARAAWEILNLHLKDFEKTAVETPELFQEGDLFSLPETMPAEDYGQQLSQGFEARELIHLWPDWEALERAREELDEIEGPDTFILHPAIRLAQVSAAMDTARERADELEEELTVQERFRDELEGASDEGLHKVSEEIVNRSDDSIQHHRLASLPLLRSEALKLERKAAELLEKMGPEWDENRVMHIDVSLQRIEEVRSWMERFERIHDEYTEAKQKYKKAAEDRQGIEKDQSRIRERLDIGAAVDMNSLARRERSVRSLRSALVERRGLKERIEPLRTRVKDMRDQTKRRDSKPYKSLAGWLAPAALIGVLSFCIGSVWRFRDGDAVSGSLFIVSALLIVILAIAVHLKRRDLVKDPTDSKRQDKELESLRRQLMKYLEEIASLQALISDTTWQLGLSSDPSSKEIEACEAGLRRERDSCTLNQERIELLKGGDGKLRMACTEEEGLHNLFMDAEKTIPFLQRQWVEWMKTLGFPPELSPQGVLDSLWAIRSARETIETRDEKRELLSRLEETVNRWEDDARDLLKRSGMPMEEGLSGEALLKAFRNLVRLCREEEERRKLLAELERNISGLKVRLERAGEQKGEAAQAQEALFEEAGVESEEEFRDRWHLFNKRQKFQKRIRDLEGRIRARIGRGPEADALLERLKTGRVAEWHKQVQAATDEGRRIQAERDCTREELEVLIESWRVLEECTTVSALQARLNAARLELERCLRELDALLLAKERMERGFQEYLRTRQSEVLIDTAIACERIISIPSDQWTEEEDLDILAEPDGCDRAVFSGDDSAGCLYLKMRLGMARGFAEYRSPLPFIVDDILAPLNEEEATQVAELLRDISRKHQVLFLTRHQETVERFMEICPDIRVENMPGRSDPPSDGESPPDDVVKDYDVELTHLLP